LDFNIESTVLFHKVKGKLYQIAKLRLFEFEDYKQVRLILNIEDWKEEYRITHKKEGCNYFDIDILPLNEDTKCKAILKIDNFKLEKDITLKPHRKWDVHIQNFTHTDIGFTDLPSRVAKSYREAIKSIIGFCDETKDFDDDCKYRWNAETGYWLDQAIRGLDEHQLKKFKSLVKKDRIELTPLYVAHTSEFNDEEILIRSMYFGFEFAKECGVKIETAMASDSTGQPWILPQILSKSGIKYFSTAVNTGMAKALKLPRPFYWKSLDGSKILLLDTDERQAYQEGVMVGLAENYDIVYKKLPQYLANLEVEGNFQFDLIAFRTPGYPGDNTKPNVTVSYIVDEWNRKWEYPKLRISTYTSYFKKFERKYGDRLKTFYGAWPDWWVNYHGATAFETGINRNTHTDIIDGERLSCLLKIRNPKLYNYPKNELKEIYKTIHLADEADWGAYSSVSEPDSLQSRGQILEEASFVYQAAINAKEVAENAKRQVAKIASSNTEFGIVVTNSLSWARSGVVEVSIPKKIISKKKNIRILDSKTGKEMMSQFVEPDIHDKQTGKIRIAFTAEYIPGMGFKMFDLVMDGSHKNEIENIANKNEIENSFYKIKYDSATGQITSIVDKELDEELIDKDSKFNFNQLIYESPERPRFVDLSTHMDMPKDVIFLQPYYQSLHDFYDYPRKGEKLNRWSPKDQKLIEVRKGKIYTEIITTSSTYMCPKAISHFILDNCFKRILIRNYIVKNETLDAEAVYYSFPFNLSSPKFKLSCHGGFYKPEEEQLPGSCKDWYCIQKWIDVSNDKLDIIWSPVEAPLVQLGDINTGKWLDKINIDNGTIFSFVMNNYWWTNSPASQGGRFWFNYAISSKRPGFDPVYSNKFGWSIHVPLSTIFVDSKDKRDDIKEYNFIENIPDNVMIIGMKESESGKGIIIRLLEISGEESSFRLKFSDRSIKNAYLTTPVEEDIKVKKVLNGVANILLHHYELVTLRVVF